MWGFFGWFAYHPPWTDDCMTGFLDSLSPPSCEPNPLPILMRAVNRLFLSRPLKQPCWRAGRFKSLT